MNKIKFSAANLKKISLPASRRVIYYDENVKYLAAIASKNGIAFYYIRKISGKTHFAKIGDFPAMTPADAQKAAHCRSPFVFPSDKTAAGHYTAPKKSWYLIFSDRRQMTNFFLSIPLFKLCL